MIRVHSLLAVVAAVVAAVATAGVAAAAVTPGLQVQSDLTGTTTLRYVQGATDDPLARIQFFVPGDFVGGYSHAPSLPIGKATARIASADLGLTIPVEGTINAAAGTDTVTVGGQSVALSTLAVACTGSAAKNAFWVANLAASGQTLQVPIFVDYTLTGPYAPFASSVMTVCLPSPDLPAGTAGRAALGAKLFDATLTFNGVYAASSGWYTWHALATPYRPGTAQSNPAGSVEAQALDRVPAALTVTARAKRGRTTVSGRVTQGGQGIGGQRVQIRAGSKVVGTARTNGSGGYSLVVSPAKRARFAATVTVAPRTLPCTGAFFAPAACSSSSYAGFTLTTRQ
jgi:hypothetical protein